MASKTASKETKASVVSKAAEADISGLKPNAAAERPDKKILVVSKEMAGKSVYGTTGMLIRFDAIGRASVSPLEAEHFKKIPGYVLG